MVFGDRLHPRCLARYIRAVRVALAGGLVVAALTTEAEWTPPPPADVGNDATGTPARSQASSPARSIRTASERALDHCSRVTAALLTPRVVPLSERAARAGGGVPAPLSFLAGGSVHGASPGAASRGSRAPASSSGMRSLNARTTVSFVDSPQSIALGGLFLPPVLLSTDARAGGAAVTTGGVRTDDGATPPPPLLLRTLIEYARQMGARQETMQGLMEYLAAHDPHPQAAPQGPSAEHAKATLTRVEAWLRRRIARAEGKLNAKWGLDDIDTAFGGDGGALRRAGNDNNFIDDDIDFDGDFTEGSAGGLRRNTFESGSIADDISFGDAGEDGAEYHGGHAFDDDIEFDDDFDGGGSNDDGNIRGGGDGDDEIADDFGDFGDGGTGSEGGEGGDINEDFAFDDQVDDDDDVRVLTDYQRGLLDDLTGIIEDAFEVDGDDGGGIARLPSMGGGSIADDFASDMGSVNFAAGTPVFDDGVVVDDSIDDDFDPRASIDFVVKSMRRRGRGDAGSLSRSLDVLESIPESVLSRVSRGGSSPGQRRFVNTLAALRESMESIESFAGSQARASDISTPHITRNVRSSHPRRGLPTDSVMTSIDSAIDGQPAMPTVDFSGLPVPVIPPNLLELSASGRHDTVDEDIPEELFDDVVDDEPNLVRHRKTKTGEKSLRMGLGQGQTDLRSSIAMTDITEGSIPRTHISGMSTEGDLPDIPEDQIEYEIDSDDDIPTTSAHDPFASRQRGRGGREGDVVDEIEDDFDAFAPGGAAGDAPGGDGGGSDEDIVDEVDGIAGSPRAAGIHRDASLRADASDIDEESIPASIAGSSDGDVASSIASFVEAAAVDADVTEDDSVSDAFDEHVTNKKNGAGAGFGGGTPDASSISSVLEGSSLGSDAGVGAGAVGGASTNMPARPRTPSSGGYPGSDNDRTPMASDADDSLATTPTEAMSSWSSRTLRTQRRPDTAWGSNHGRDDNLPPPQPRMRLYRVNVITGEPLFDEAEHDTLFDMPDELLSLPHPDAGYYRGHDEDDREYSAIGPRSDDAQWAHRGQRRGRGRRPRTAQRLRDEEAGLVDSDMTADSSSNGSAAF